MCCSLMFSSICKTLRTSFFTFSSFEFCSGNMIPNEFFSDCYFLWNCYFVRFFDFLFSLLLPHILVAPFSVFLRNYFQTYYSSSLLFYILCFTELVVFFPFYSFVYVYWHIFSAVCRFNNDRLSNFSSSNRKITCSYRFPDIQTFKN